MKKGSIYYKAWVNVKTYSGDDRTAVIVEEWHVTHVTSKVIYLVQKVDKVTWVKKSRKHFDYGFEDSAKIPSYYKMKVFPGQTSKQHELYTTKKAAIRSTLPKIKAIQKRVAKLLADTEKQVKS